MMNAPKTVKRKRKIQSFKRSNIFKCIFPRFQFLQKIIIFSIKGPVIIYGGGGGGGGGGAPKRNVFRAKYFADPTIKKSKI
jgi:hypothetical protein